MSLQTPCTDAHLYTQSPHAVHRLWPRRDTSWRCLPCPVGRSEVGPAGLWGSMWRVTACYITPVTRMLLTCLFCGLNNFTHSDYITE
ncbi:hypothetical protein E2C01_047667 [Portunus trituberculatus]|uniref:Uncharacterized protein n=1 Tax=Portunus trituberculatus TaxID=210409 RepID=A0A5B7G9H2_PORTR|nr:hypothetical protein [Portunus trituberculatus]